MNDAPHGSDSESEEGAVVDPTAAATTNFTPPDAGAPPIPTYSQTPAETAQEVPAPLTPTSAGPPVPLAPAGTTAAVAPVAVTDTATPGTPAAPATAGIVAKATDLARRVGTERALGAALSGAIVYGAAWVVSLIVVILALVAASDSSPDWGWAFEGPGQLVGLSVGGIFTLGATVMGVSAKVAVVWLPLLVTAVVVVGAAFLARRDERAHPSATRGVRWVRSAITGVALSLLVLLVSGVLPVRYEFGDGSSDPLAGMMSGGGSGSALSFTAFLGAVLIATAASYVARAQVSTTRAPRAATPLRLAAAGVTRALAVYVTVVSVLLAIGLLIYSVVRSGVEPLLTAFLWLPTVVIDGLGWINFAPIGLSGSAFSLPGISDSPTSYWMPAELPVWGTAIILVVNLALIAATGIVLAVARPHSRLSTAARWATTVVSFAALGVVISLLGSITAWSSVDTSGVSDSLDSLLGGSSGMIDSIGSVRATVGLAAWTFIIFAVLGALVEAAAIYLAPQLIPLLPASLVARIPRAAGAASAVATAPGAASTVPGATVESDEATSEKLGAVGVAEDTAVTPVPYAEPMSPERKKKVVRILAIVGAAIVLVVGAAVAISVVNSTVYSPKNQVEAYLDNLIDGNASAVLEAVDVDAANASRVLLTDEVLSATDGGITGYKISDVTVSGDTATITAELDQDGSKSTVDYYVARDGKTAVFFDNWEMDSVYVGTMSLSLPEGVTDITVNDVEVSVGDVDSDYGYVELPAFPGEYVIELSGTNEFLASEPQTAVVTADLEGYAEPLSFELEPTEAFTAEVASQIDALVASCTAQGLIEAEDCPVYTYAYGNISNVAWTINEPATFEILDYGNGEWYVQVDDRGSATVTYTRTTTYSEPSIETDDVDFSVNGTVEMVDGAPVYTYGY
jgi:hypothetical protein